MDIGISLSQSIVHNAEKIPLGKKESMIDLSQRKKKSVMFGWNVGIIVNNYEKDRQAS